MPVEERIGFVTDSSTSKNVKRIFLQNIELIINFKVQSSMETFSCKNPVFGTGDLW